MAVMRDMATDPTALAAAYASGRMPSPLRLLVDTHAAMDAEARLNTAVADAIGGAMLERIAPAEVSDDALINTLRALDALDEPQRQATRAARAAGASLQELIDLPEPVRARAFAAVERDGWRFAGPGVRAMDLDGDDDTKAQLLRIEPGVGVPTHGHTGFEATLVLTGAFRDGDGVYGRGDLCLVGPGTVHKPVAEPHGVCLALAVTDAPLEFQGALGLIQKVFRLN